MHSIQSLEWLRLLSVAQRLKLLFCCVSRRLKTSRPFYDHHYWDKTSIGYGSVMGLRTDTQSISEATSKELAPKSPKANKSGTHSVISATESLLRGMIVYKYYINIVHSRNEKIHYERALPAGSTG